MQREKIQRSILLGVLASLLYFILALITSSMRIKLGKEFNILADGFAVMVVSLGSFVVLINIIINIFKLFKFMPYSHLEAYDEFLVNMPDFNGHVEQLCAAVKNKKLKTKGNLYESHMNETNDEFKTLIIRFLEKKRKQLLKNICFCLIALIIIFSSLYIMDCTLEFCHNNKPGFSTTIIPNGKLIRQAIDGIYYSVVTITTLGFGDIHPGDSVIARILAIFEVLSFIFIFSLALNLMLQGKEDRYIYDPCEFTNILRKKLKEEEIINS